MSSIPVFDISNPLGGLLDQAVSMVYVNEKRTTTKGAVDSFEDNIEHAVSIKADIDPTLDGVSAVNVTRCGKNLFNSSTVFTETGSYMYAKSIFPKNTNLICKFVDKDPTVDISGIYFGFYDDTYTSGAASSGHYRWLINNGTVQSNLSNMASGGGSVLCDGLFASPKNQTTIDTLLARYDIQVEVGTVSTDYAPYSATTRTISLGQTVYGGSVTVDEDGECELTENRSVLVFDGSDEQVWTIHASGTDTTVFKHISGVAIANETNEQVSPNTITYSSAANTADSSRANTIRWVTSGNVFIQVANTTATTATELKNWLALNNVKITANAATPTTSTLTPITPINTLEGVNNIWCDTGDIEVGYYYQLYQPI